MLSCKEVTQRAGDWTDGALSWRQRLAIRLHLLMCALCRRFLHQYRLAADTAATQACQHHPDEIGRVLAHIERSDSESSNTERKPPSPR